MDRVRRLRAYMDDLLEETGDAGRWRAGLVHLYGVSQAAALLALRRGLPVELAEMAGLLHDISSYRDGYTKDHGPRGAVMARQVLEELSLTDAAETEAVCTAIANHSAKDRADGPLDELLKDADVLQHVLYDPRKVKKEDEGPRYRRILRELGCAGETGAE